MTNQWMFERNYEKAHKRNKIHDEEKHDQEIRKMERDVILKILREQQEVFQSELDERDAIFSERYREGKVSGIRIAIMEIEARRTPCSLL